MQCYGQFTICFSKQWYRWSKHLSPWITGRCCLCLMFKWQNLIVVVLSLQVYSKNLHKTQVDHLLFFCMDLYSSWRSSPPNDVWEENTFSLHKQHNVSAVTATNKEGLFDLPSGQLCVYFWMFISMCAHIIMWISFIFVIQWSEGLKFYYGFTFKWSEFYQLWNW